MAYVSGRGWSRGETLEKKEAGVVGNGLPLGWRGMEVEA